MAIKKALSKSNLTNSYGIDFKKAYFKIEDVSTDFDLGNVKIYVRAYAAEEARTMQKSIENEREKYTELSMGGEAFDVAFKESKFKNIDEFRHYIDVERDKSTHNIVGIYKEKFVIKLDDLKLKAFTKDAIMTACYNYLKTLKEFENGIDC